MTLTAPDDVRVAAAKPLLPPAVLLEEIPLSEKAQKSVQKGRMECQNVVEGKDDRLIVIVGPCSIHDPKAAREYCERLLPAVSKYQKDLVVVMRVYFEKPRTNVGWKGLINDPDLNGSFAINKGLRIGRQLLVDINEMGVPAAVEFLDTISPQFIADCVAWGAIGARTTESQVHRELASGVSCPIGFKNGTNGDIQIAVDAIISSKNPHHFLGVTKQGLAAIIETRGNSACHVILRGASSGPNYSAEHVQACADKLKAAKIKPSIMVDCSHGNSEKKHENQPKVAASIAQQLETDKENQLIGVMIESNLVEGNQKIGDGDLSKLVYGKSVTDACVNVDTTYAMLDQLAAGVQKRRSCK
jgi:3-deoxy-7-phosphoheptulonate synthase